MYINIGYIIVITGFHNFDLKNKTNNLKTEYFCGHPIPKKDI